LQSHHDLSPTGATERNNEQHLAQEKRAGFPAPAVSAFSYGKQSLKTTDAAHADQTLSPISDKEREQNRLQAAQLIGEIGNQAADIARTEGQIRATNAGKAELASKDIREPGEGAPKAEWADYNKALAATDSYKAAAAPFGTGSALQQGIQAATAAVQGLAGGSLAQAVTGAAAPYLAEVIHNQTLNADGSVNVQANLMVHAVVGAVTAYAAGLAGK